MVPVELGDRKSIAEVDVRVTAAHALDPDVLNSVDVRLEVVVRHEHVRVERSLVAVARPIELGGQDDHALSRRHGPALFTGEAAGEGRRHEQLLAVPMRSLPRRAAGEPTGREIADAAEAAVAMPLRI